MENKQFNAIGVVEINVYTNALIVLDEMLKTSDVHLVGCEKRLGGRMVSIIVGGDTSSVNAAIEAAKQAGRQVGEQNIKVAVAIPNPHSEIKKLLNLIKPPIQSLVQTKKQEVKQEVKQDEKQPMGKEVTALKAQEEQIHITKEKAAVVSHALEDVVQKPNKNKPKTRRTK